MADDQPQVVLNIEPTLRPARITLPPFRIVRSEQFVMSEQQLQAYDTPITRILEANSVKDIQEAEDRSFLAFVEEATRRIMMAKIPCGHVIVDPSLDARFPRTEAGRQIEP